MRRPALVMGSPDTFGAGFPFVIVTPLTTTHRRLSLHVAVDSTADTGLDENSYVRCELIRSINRNRLLHRLGAVENDPLGESEWKEAPKCPESSSALGDR